jgi:DNA-binding transcriptional LysR family regulator
MELRHLRYFVAVAESLHFCRAAAKLHIAQPSLSHQIAQLEAELQTRLLTRTKRRVELTNAGRLFLREAKDILARANRAATVTRLLGSESQRLRVGVGYCTDQTDIAAVIGKFHTRHHEIQVETKTMSTPAQLAALIDEQLDIGFVRPPVTDDVLNSRIVISEPLVAALPRTHSLVSLACFPLSALANEQFVLPPRDIVPAFHDAVLTACREAGFIPHAPNEADHLLMVLEMVAANAGVALVPAAAYKLGRKDVVYRRLNPAANSLETAIAWRRSDNSPMLTEFVDAARLILSRRGSRDH